MKRALLAVLMLTFSTLALAEFHVSEYDGLKNEETFKTYIYGVGVGLSWANAVAIDKNRTPLFCQPLRLKLNGPDYMKMLDNAVTEWRKSRKGSDPDPVVELLLVDRLIDMFPCQTPKR